MTREKRVFIIIMVVLLVMMIGEMQTWFVSLSDAGGGMFNPGG